MTIEEATDDLTSRIARGCNADVLLGQLGSPVVVRTTGPGEADNVCYPAELGAPLAKLLCQVLMTQYGLQYNISGTILGTRIISYGRP